MCWQLLTSGENAIISDVGFPQLTKNAFGGVACDGDEETAKFSSLQKNLDVSARQTSQRRGVTKTNSNLFIGSNLTNTL